MYLKLDAQLRTLDTWFTLAEKQENDEIKAHMSNYLCIRVSGIMESALKLIFQHYVDGKCPQNIATFTNKQISKINNVESDKIANLLGLFSNDWKSKYIKYVEGQLESSLNSIVGQRHNLAHNFNNNSISLNQVKSYYSDIKKIISFLQHLVH